MTASKCLLYCTRGTESDTTTLFLGVAPHRSMRPHGRHLLAVSKAARTRGSIRSRAPRALRQDLCAARRLAEHGSAPDGRHERRP